MKGIIFNLLESFISESWGEDKYERIEEKCTLKTTEPFVGPGSYPDEDVIAIIRKATSELNVPVNEFLQRWGRFCIPKLVDKYPFFFERAQTAKDFLLQVDSIHAIEVKKLYKDAEPPHFIYQDTTPDQLVMRYTSKRKLCQFIKGLIEGVADYYKSSVEYTKETCMLDGDEYCEFRLKFKL